MSPLARKTILVIDDEPDIRFSLELLLHIVGFRVALAANGQEALNYLHTHPAPCMIVLDLRMPVMSGYQFRAEQLRDPDLARIPVIISSAEFKMAGAETFGNVLAFCPKASDPLDLVRLVRNSCA